MEKNENNDNNYQNSFTVKQRSLENTQQAATAAAATTTTPFDAGL